MDWVNLLGYAAAASVLATFCMRTMIPLLILTLVNSASTVISTISIPC